MVIFLYDHSFYYILFSISSALSGYKKKEQKQKVREEEYCGEQSRAGGD